MIIQTDSGNEVSLSNSSGNARSTGAVRIYSNGVRVVEVIIDKRNPLGYLRDRIRGGLLEDFHRQIANAVSNGSLSMEDVDAIEQQTGVRCK